MIRLANTISKIAIFLGVIALVLALIVHVTGNYIWDITHWGFGATAISFLLLAIALNSLGLTEESES